MATRIRVTFKEWNADKLLAAAGKVLEEFAPELAEQARAEITAVKWDWPAPTLRFESLLMGGTPERGGVLIPQGKRDIVDTGQLLNSQQAPVVRSSKVGYALSIEWTAPYAKNILLGKYDPYINPEGRKATPEQVKRNWLTSTLEAKPFMPFLVARWNAKASGQ